MRIHIFRRSAFTLLELLVVIAIIGILIALLLPSVQAAREAARRFQCANHLSQLGLAIKQYELHHGVLPSGTTNETGPIRNVPIGNHMGWIPRILPYLEQTPLYERIDFSKGVYDPENQPVWATATFPALNCPSERSSGGDNHSNYAACTGGEEVPIDTTNKGVFFLNSKLRSRDIPDGTSSTIFVGESQIFQEIHFGPHDKSSHWRYSSLKFIEPAPYDHEEPKEDESEEDAALRRFAGSAYVYGGLGWMSGTPGTLRNTANRINTYVGPFSNWPMPFGSGSYGSGGLNTSAFPWSETVTSQEETSEAGMSFGFDSGSVIEIDKEDDELRQHFEPTDPAKTWKLVLPGQFLVGGYGSNHTGGANFLFGDGNVKFVNEGIDLTMLQQMGNRADSKAKEL